MKKVILIVIAIFTISLGHSQDSKFYLGVGLGIATAGGDVSWVFCYLSWFWYLTLSFERVKQTKLKPI